MSAERRSLDAGRERDSRDSPAYVADGSDEGLRNNDDGNHHAGVTPGADVAPMADGQGDEEARSSGSSNVGNNVWASGSETRGDRMPEIGRLDLSHQNKRGAMTREGGAAQIY